jgi:hypothetical protein
MLGETKLIYRIYKRSYRGERGREPAAPTARGSSRQLTMAIIRSR